MKLQYLKVASYLEQDLRQCYLDTSSNNLQNLYSLELQMLSPSL